MRIEKIRPIEEKEKFLERDEIFERIANLMKFVMSEKKITLKSDEVQQRDIITLPRDRAKKIKVKREFLIDVGIDELEKMTRRGEIAPNFFHGIADKSEFAVMALKEAVKMMSEEKEKKSEKYPS